MTLAGTERKTVMRRLMLVPCPCFEILDILLYSVCTVFGGCVKSSEVYFMIIYWYDINSLSCLTRFIHDPPNIVLILIQNRIFLQAQRFTGITSRVSVYFFFTRKFFWLLVDDHVSFAEFFKPGFCFTLS